MGTGRAYIWQVGDSAQVAGDRRLAAATGPIREVGGQLIAASVARALALPGEKSRWASSTASETVRSFDAGGSKRRRSTGNDWRPRYPSLRCDVPPGRRSDSGSGDLSTPEKARSTDYFVRRRREHSAMEERSALSPVVDLAGARMERLEAEELRTLAAAPGQRRFDRSRRSMWPSSSNLSITSRARSE